MLQLKLGSKGEIVIPKKVRDSLGFLPNQRIVMSVRDGAVVLSAAKGSDIVEEWRRIAAQEGCDVKKKFVYGDKLYEEVFGRALP